MFIWQTSAPLHFLGGPRIDPRIEDALDGIGWQRVKGMNLGRAVAIGRCLNSTGGRWSKDRAGAKRNLAAHHKLMLALERVLMGLQEMPPEIVKTLNVVSCPVRERDRGIPDRVSGAIHGLEELVDGLIEVEAYLRHEMGESRRGRPSNQAAERIARAIAEIYVLGTGRLPTYGTLHDSSGPSGRFGKTLSIVMPILGFQEIDIVNLAKHAVESLSDECAQELRTARKHGDRARLSLFRQVD